MYSAYKREVTNDTRNHTNLTFYAADRGQPALLKIIQDQERRIAELETRIEESK